MADDRLRRDCLASEAILRGVAPLHSGELGGRRLSNSSGHRKPPKETRFLFIWDSLGGTVERGGAAVEGDAGGVISSVYEAFCCPPPPAPAVPPPPFTSGKVLRSERKQEVGTCVVREEEEEEEDGSASLPRTSVRVQGTLPPRPPTLPPFVRNNKKGGCLYYGDCVAGLLWAELGDRLGLQLPGGAPLGRPPAAPLSKPSEFSSISWMRGGMEPGISIFRVMTRSAPARKSWRERNMNMSNHFKIE
ncbi:hypothetical protein EYF80_015209 [Liparis tanakae]|uniref:Uncharacterized protein n=1 Tax=Liparis tanakae TaxID=230148 RepID=A0A4Z2IB80_9TELE|nr:hypothetical protein EYF80_015209 [Liparis tanakae]